MTGESTPSIPAFAPEVAKASFIEKVRDLPKSIRDRVQGSSAERSMRAKLTPDRVQEIRAEREASGSSLNVTEDTAYKALEQKQKDAILAQKGLQAEITGTQVVLSPSEIAEAQRRAFSEFARQHPDKAVQYRKTGLHLGKADSEGNRRIDPKSDPFVRAVDMQARSMKKAGDVDGAAKQWDQFVRECPDKARIYALQGHKDIRQALSRVGGERPRSTAQRPVAEQTKGTNREGGTEDPLSQQQKDINKMRELSRKPKESMKFKERNDLLKLQNELAPALKRARELAAKLDASNFLSDEELADLEPFEDLIKEENKANGEKEEIKQAAAAPAAKEGASPVSEAQRRALGSEAIGKLKDRGIDISKMSEEDALKALADGKIQNSPGDLWHNLPATQEYIRGAYAEQQRLQAEAAVASIPSGTIEQLETEHGIRAKAILELLLALLATGAISLGKDIATTTTS